MSNSKISALPASTTPLAGTEVLPIVQSSATKQVSVANLTAGRAVSASTLAGTTNTETAVVAGNAANDAGAGVRILGALTQRNWMLSSNNFTAGLLEITPSTANGGTSFSTPVIKINAAGDQTLVSGNLTQGTAAKGINFTANSAAAGKTSQLLNWYEEGTWTPSLSAFSGTITTVGACTGRYTRIGRQVTVSVDAAITTNGTASTVLFVSGLPYTGASSYYAGCGEERSTAKTLSVEYQTATNKLAVYFYDGTYPGANGSRFIITVTYDV